MSDAGAGEPASGTARRRRRRGPTAEAAAPPADVATAAASAPPATPTNTPPTTQRRRDGAGHAVNAKRAERAERELSGAGRSQLGVVGALRARDVNRPTADDLAEAEREVKIVRRHWTPDEGR